MKKIPVSVISLICGLVLAFTGIYKAIYFSIWYYSANLVFNVFIETLLDTIATSALIIFMLRLFFFFRDLERGG